MAASQRILLGHIKGEKGDQGDPATVTVGTVQTTAAGGNAQVTPGGTPQDLVLNFVLPRGDPGPGGGAITPLRSNALPMIYRVPFNENPAGGHHILGAMDLLGWVPRGRIYPNRETRINYFTTHPTQGVLQAWHRTAYSPYMEINFQNYQNAPMYWTRACPINFGTLGYRGCWNRSYVMRDYDSSISWWNNLRRDFDGLVFTANGNQALWIYGRGTPHGTTGDFLQNPNSGGGNNLTYQAITLVGLTNTAITAMWAGVNAVGNWIWVIQGGNLFRTEILNSTSAPQGSPGTSVARRVTGPADMAFTQVTNVSTGNALPTAMNRVYAEGHYACVWGPAPNNRIAYFDGTNWAALTTPFAHGGTANLAIIFANGRLAVLNNNNGDYYTCDNPMAGASAVWTLRYRVEANMMLTNGFQRGIPQFIPRGFGWSLRKVYSEFDGTSHDGGNCWRNPRGPEQTMFPWPNELLCSTSRPDIVPCQLGQVSYRLGAYVYTYGVNTTSVSLFGDQRTAVGVSDWSPLVTEYATVDAQGQQVRNAAVMPPGVGPATPASYLAATGLRGPATFADNANLRAGGLWSADPGSVAG